MSMAGAKMVSLVLIVRNEEQGIRQVMPRAALGIFDDCFAVDGHSTDRTCALLEQMGIRCCQQSRPGMGAAMLEARQYVRTKAFVFFHPDGNEDPADIPKMVRLLRDGHEFVVASRMVPGAWNEEDAHLLKWRKWANQGLALLANLLFARGGNRTTDVTNGFRGITCNAFDRMELTSTDLTLDFQMIIRALKLGIKITEFPTHEYARAGGQTNFPSMLTGIAELKLLVREMFQGWSPSVRPSAV